MRRTFSSVSLLSTMSLLAVGAGACTETPPSPAATSHPAASVPSVREPAAAPEITVAEPTKTTCTEAVERAHRLAEALPAGDLSRYFAERDLQQANAEAGNGEFDDCLEWADKAETEVREHRHTLKPGETLQILPAGR